MDNYIELLKFVLPPFLLDHFDLIKTSVEEDKLHLYFEETAKPPEEFRGRLLVSKGFHKEVRVQDFPLRGKFVYLHVRRRRWTDKESGGILQRDWSLATKGTRLTKEFADFLKGLGQY